MKRIWKGCPTASKQLILQIKEDTGTDCFLQINFVHLNLFSDLSRLMLLPTINRLRRGIQQAKIDDELKYFKKAFCHSLWKLIRRVVRIIWYSFIILSVLFAVVYFFFPKQFGIVEAKYDLWRKNYQIHVYGLPPYSGIDYEKMDRYGIKVVTVAGCVVDRFIMEKTASYNTVVIEPLGDKIGDKEDWRHFMEYPEISDE